MAAPGRLTAIVRAACTLTCVQACVLACVLACTVPSGGATTASSSAVGPGGSPPESFGPPRELAGELRPGDEECPNLCDRHRFTWAAPVRVTVRAHATDYQQIYVAAEGAGVAETGAFGSRSDVAFTVVPGVEYAVTISAYSSGGRGAYTFTVEPPPQVEILAPVAPLPAPPTPEEREPDEALPGKIATVMEGWTPVEGHTLRGDLAKVPALVWKTRRGRCYRVVVVLESGARKNDDWYGMSLRSESRAGSIGTSAGFIADSARVLEGGGDEGLCPSRNGKLVLAFEHRHKYVPLAAAGIGRFRAELYERPIDPAVLDERDRADDEDWCRGCVKQQAECLTSGDTGEYRSCGRQFSACLYNGGLSRKECEP